MSAGGLDHRIRFEERQFIDDGHGNRRGEWVPRFTRWGGFMLLKGGEAVTAGRLAGRSAAVLKVRTCRATRGITSEWRAVDLLDETVWKVKEPPRMTPDRAFLEMMVESGGEAD
jgi:head-tail adaptor